MNKKKSHYIKKITTLSIAILGLTGLYGGTSSVLAAPNEERQVQIGLGNQAHTRLSLQSSIHWGGVAVLAIVVTMMIDICFSENDAEREKNIKQLKNSIPLLSRAFVVTFLAAFCHGEGAVLLVMSIMLTVCVVNN